jgi:phosphoglycolate phosphatase
VIDVLHALQKQGIHMHICTNRPQDLCLDVLERLGIRSFFKICIGGDDGLERKPNPAMLLYLLTQINIPPSQALFVGDSVVDLSAGSRAGLATLGVDWGYTPADLLKKHHPSGFLNTPLDLLSFFPI